MVVAGIVALGAALATPTAASAAPATRQAATANLDATARGLIYRGLQPAGTGDRCDKTFRLVFAADGACTHGPDPAPPGVDVRRRDRFAADTGTGTTAAGTSSPPCYTDGSSGNRVQAIYAHAAGSDNLSQYRSSMSAWAAATDQVFNLSAGETGGVRHVRFVTDSTCNLVVSDVQLSSAAMSDFGTTITELRQQGFNRPDRKYLVWADTNVYCGIAQIYNDDSAAQTNVSNGSSSVAGEFARVDYGCWGLSGQSIEAHEIMHTLGGVQTTAPHHTTYNHCWDESDRMCYDDGSGIAMVQTCQTWHENYFDCNHDDYYYAGTPASTNYLSNHWNTANSSFLATADPVAPAPTPTTTTPPTTSPPTTSPPTTTPPTTTPPPPSLPTTFRAYGGFPGGTRVARGDVDGNGTSEIVTGAGPGGGPDVRLFKTDGTFLKNWFAYDSGFRGGVDVAACDLDGDGKAEIITGPGPGGGPDVRVFTSSGTLLKSFFAYDGGFSGGVDVAGGNVDGTGAAEIITGPGAGGGPDTRIFRGDATLVRSWYAYDGGFSGGVRVSCADLNNDGKCEVVTAPGAGGGPDVRTFNSSGTMLSNFFALSPALTGGLDVGAAADGIVSSTWSGTDVVHVPAKS